MNALNTNIVGRYVVLRAGYRPMLHMNQGARKPGQSRVFLVSGENCGDGAFPSAAGHLLFGRWVDTLTRAVVDARDIEREATLEDVANAKAGRKVAYR